MSWRKGVLIGMTLLLLTGLLWAQPQMRFGWPHDLGIGGTSSLFEPNPVAVAVRADGSEVIVVCNNTTVSVYDLNGTIEAEWDVAGDIPGANYLSSGPNLGDLNGDGELEAVFTMRSPNGRTRGLVAYTLEGEVFEELAITHNLDYVDISTTTVVDIDGDGMDEVLYTADHELKALNGDGTQAEGFPWSITGANPHWIAGPVVYQWPNQTTAVIWVTIDNNVHARLLDADDEIEGFPVSFSGDSFTSPPNLIPTGNGWMVTVVNATNVCLWDDSGNMIEGFPVTPQNTAGTQITAASLGDIDGNGTADIIFKPSNADIHAIDLQGNYLEGYPIDVGNNGMREIASVIKDNSVADGMLFFGCLTATAGQTDFHGYEFNDPMPGFPVTITCNETMPRMYTALFMPTDNTLHIVVHTILGYTAVFDLAFDGTDPYMEWAMPCNNMGGNRLYNPTTIPTEFPDLAFNPDELDFGDVMVGETGEYVIEVVNSGTADGVVTSLTPGEGLEGQFSTLEELPVTVPVDGSADITLIWTPLEPGEMMGEVTFHHNDASHNNREVISVQGNYLAPVLEFSTDAIDFGELVNEEFGEATFDVTNTGNADGVIDSFLVNGENVDEISLDQTFPFTIASGATETITVRWEPTVTSELDGTLWLYHNDPLLENQHRIELTGVYTNAVDEFGNPIPDEFFLAQNHPNPFNPVTTIRYGVKENESIHLRVFNVNGQEIAELVNCDQSAGIYQLTFDASHLAAGMYYCVLDAGQQQFIRTMVLVK